MNVMIVKLTSGEDIIGKIETGESYIEIKNPMVLVMRPDAGGQMKGGMVPFAPFADEDNVRIYPHAIAADYKPSQDLVNEYNRIFGGIVVANQMPIVKG
jgi:hypothetical protein